METVGDRLAKAQASGDLDAIRSALLDAKAAGADPAQIDTALAEVQRQKAAQASGGSAPALDSAAAVAATEASAAAEARASAEAYKKKGNERLKVNTKTAAREAMECFTTGLEVRCGDSVLNAQLYSNRAHVRILLRQFVEAVDDCRKAIDLDPKNIKAYWRAAKASLHLDLYTNAIEFCEAGLRKEPSDSDLMKMKSVCAEKQAGQQRRRAELATTASSQEFSADEAMALQERVNGLSEQVESLKATITVKKRDHMKSQLTRRTLSEMTEDTCTYISVGRCFLKKERTEVESELASTVEALEIDVPKLSKTLQELEKRREEAEKELKEMIHAFKVQTSAGPADGS